MRLQTPSSFSVADGTIHLHCPTSWEEMTQDQLRYVLYMLTTDFTEYAVRTFIFVRLTGITVHRRTRQGWLCSVKADDGNQHRFFLTKEHTMDMLSELDYIFDGRGAANRLEEIGGCRAVDVDLHDVQFFDYLALDNYYQAYLSDQTDTSTLTAMAQILYPKAVRVEANKTRYTASDIKPDAVEQMGVLLWFMHVKTLFGDTFRHLYKPASGMEGSERQSQVERMNAQIRTLTGGDITKEGAVRLSDTWRALTELDAKAREAEEYNKMMKK